MPCEFCEAEFPYDVHAEHTDFCGSKTEKCTYCRKYIMLKDKASHYEVKNYMNRSVIWFIYNFLLKTIFVCF